MMSKDEQARARLVEIALQCAAADDDDTCPLCDPATVRSRASFRDPSKGHWGAAGLTAAMDDAGLVVPAPGTPARRGAIALADFVASTGCNVLSRVIGQQWVAGTPNDGTFAKQPEPGDIIAWLQHPSPDPAGWRRGHVAVIVAVDDESITTVSWNEGPKPGRVMMRRLWRDLNKGCLDCGGMGRRYKPSGVCMACRGEGFVARSSTVPWRRPGGLYGIARPVAR
jgi:hypothetical protein